MAINKLPDSDQKVSTRVTPVKAAIVGLFLGAIGGYLVGEEAGKESILNQKTPIENANVTLPESVSDKLVRIGNIENDTAKYMEIVEMNNDHMSRGKYQ